MIELVSTLMDEPKKDFRDSIFGAVAEYIRENENAILLTNDMGAQGIEKIKSFAPTQVINVGITEQNMMSMAAGLALSGHFVFVYGIAEHIILRAFEQIKLDICVQNLPVCIIGVGAGLAYGQDGPTHHGTEDIAVLRVLPNISIFNPCDCYSAAESVRYVISIKSPSYIRMDKEQLPELYSPKNDLENGFSIHGEVEGGAFVHTGVVGWTGLKAKENLSQENIASFCIDIWKIKPMNWTKLSQFIEAAEWLVFLDESVRSGGLSEYVLANTTHNSARFLIRKDLGDDFLARVVKSRMGLEKS